MENAVEMLIQGGAVGVALAVLYVSHKRDQANNKTINNHLQHVHETNEKFNATMAGIATQMTKANDTNDRIIGAMGEHGRILDRVERLMDKK